jgi:eukaryotic-like serine/threonine-protein kinase
MGSATVSDNGSDRRAVVRSNDILDTPLDRAFDRVTALAARIFEVPIGVLTVKDDALRRLGSGRGADAEALPSGSGLCAWTIRQEERWLVEDARVDLRTLTDPVVAGQLGLRFHLAIPLHTNDGLDLGTLCVVDREPASRTPAGWQTYRLSVPS